MTRTEHESLSATTFILINEINETNRLKTDNTY